MLPQPRPSRWGPRPDTPTVPDIDATPRPTDPDPPTIAYDPTMFDVEPVSTAYDPTRVDLEPVSATVAYEPDPPTVVDRPAPARVGYGAASAWPPMDPRPQRGPAPVDDPDRSWARPALVGGIFLVGLLVGALPFAVGFLSADDEQSASPNPSSPSSTTTAPTAAVPVPTTPVPTSPPPTPSTVTTAAPPSTTSAPAPSSTRAPSGGAGNLSSGYAVRLATARQGVSREESDIAELLSKVRAEHPNAAVYASEDLAGRVDIGDGFLVLLLDGFDSAADARTQCAELPASMTEYGCVVDAVG